MPYGFFFYSPGIYIDLSLGRQESVREHLRRRARRDRSKQRRQRSARHETFAQQTVRERRLQSRVHVPAIEKVCEAK